MKYLIIALAFMAALPMGTKAQNSAVKEVKTVVEQFASAGDTNDAEALDHLLDSNYRIVMNQLFGSKDITIMDKSTYLNKIRTKEFGGDQRELKFDEIIINDNSAMCHVIMKGQKATFDSLILLVRNAEGKWQLISDTPTVR